MSGWNEAAWFVFTAGLALKGTAVLGAAWLAALLLRKRPAAERHWVWTSAALTLFALPAFAFALPALHIPTAPWLPDPAAVLFHVNGTAGAGGDQTVATRAAVPMPANARLISPFDWRLSLMLLWAAGSGLAFARMLLAYAAVGRARASARPFTDRALCHELSRRLGIGRRVELLQAGCGAMPMTLGVVRPAVLLPSEAAAWSEERRRMVLLHELAHVRRGDVAAHCMARTALALYWWNPLAWKAWREFLKERELAADDVVLRAGERASDYAGHLVAVARSMQLAPAMGWAGVPMARRSQLEHRVAAILDSRIERSATGRAWGFAAAVAAIAIAGPLAAVRAQDSTPSVPADVNTAVRIAQAQKNYESLENAAKAAEQRGQYDTAKQFLDPAVELRAEKAGRQSIEYALGLLKLGDLESKRNQNQSAEDFYSRAVQILGDRPEAARALVVLGITAIERKDYSRAVEYLERAQHNDPRQAGVALMWLGVTHSSEGDVNEADAHFKAALALQDPNSTGAVTILQVYSRFLLKQGRQDEAKELATRAMETQKSIAAKPAFDAGVHKIGPGISAPVPLTRINPQYTNEARVAQLQGTALVSVEIGTDGLAHNIQVVRGLGLGLDEKAVEAIQQWIFKPGMKDGQPVPVMASIEVNFRLL